MRLPLPCTSPSRWVLIHAGLVFLSLAGASSRSFAQQEPVAVIAVANIDGLLADVDDLFAAAGAPHHAQMIRGVVANFNNFRGLDRTRPVGMYFYFPSAGQTDPQPLLFFPVADVDELIASVQLGNALRLEQGATSSRLILHTEEGPIPIKLQDGYAFADPTRSDARLQAPLTDPSVLLGDTLKEFDVALIVRREGIPPFLFEVAKGQLRTEALRQQPQSPGESDEEYAIRREIQQAVFALAESVVNDWRGAVVGLSLSAEERQARLSSQILLDPKGETAEILQRIRRDQSQFAAQIAEESALSLAMKWQPTSTGREVLASIVETMRNQINDELAQADETSRAAVARMVDALETTVSDGVFDSFSQLVGAPPNGFVFISGTAVESSSELAAGIEQLLPFAAESDEIREVEMDFARAGEVAIHRMWPKQLRKQDRRLYGDDAAIYVAAGNGALWLAIGTEEAADLLADSIQMQPTAAGAVLARPSTLSGGPKILSDNGFVDLVIHASEWVGFAPVDGGGRKAELARAARQAFENPAEDTFRLQLGATEDRLQLELRLGYGFVRLFGLAVAAGIDQQ